MGAHYTGKERDSESGLDYFGARYYASTVGRWMSPDWAQKAEPVPYAKMDDPQSLNLYGYVGNNPIAQIDADGHFGSKDHIAIEIATLKAMGYGAKAAERAARSDAGLDGWHNMASGVPFLHHFVETSENPQHAEQSDHSDVETAKSEANQFVESQILSAAWKAVGGEAGQALDALGKASHTVQDAVRHQYETAGQHPLGEKAATDSEKKAADAATRGVVNRFESTVRTIAKASGMTSTQTTSVIESVRNYTPSEKDPK
ncbi:MAG: RHS repeat-associated core domain-containing protein [Acidobacteria bacterium]|nr:RHS repeat-associated core domain-containing protein [Acidobacteriota bacterium]